ncbi:hypothetical protein KCU73_g6381, partial [Aureobasidium melanogenum]
MADNQLLDLATPPACIADFCLIPLGTPTASVSKEVSQVQRLLKKKGSWDDVMRVIGQAHGLLHDNGVVRIQSDIRVGSRTDKKQTSEDKVAAVKAILDKDEQA